MKRGDRREPIFKDDKDRVLFLTTLCECYGKTSWRVPGEHGIPKDATAGRRKPDPRKVKPVDAVAEETTMTLKWVEEELHMGAWTNVSNLSTRESRKKQ